MGRAGVDTDHMKALIRDVADFPGPGIVFKDITPLLGDGAAWSAAVTALAGLIEPLEPTKILGIEARGFLVGAPVAHELGLGFVPVRKPGKLPWHVTTVSYSLEYGQDSLEMHVDGVGEGERIVIVDDVLATGGTAAATVELARRGGADVVGLAFLLELGFLAGRQRLPGQNVHALLEY